MYLLYFFLSIALPAYAWPGAVVRVVDGDTLVVAPLGGTDADVSVQLYGVDAPELDQPGGVAARDILMSLIGQGDAVGVVGVNTDQNHHSTALVLHEGRFLNLTMLQQGHAWVYRQYCRAAFCPQWIEAEEAARQEKLGLWQDEAPMPPWQWREKDTRAETAAAP